MQGFNSTWTVNFLMFKLVLEKAEGPEIKLPTSTGSSKMQESSRETSISALLTIPKPFTVWSEVAQSCLTLSDPMDCSPPGSSIHGFSRQEYWRGVPLPCILYCAFYHLIHALLLASSWPSPSLPSHPPPFTAYIPLILKYLLITKTMMSLFMVQAFVHAMQRPLLSVHVWLPLAIFQSSA